MADAPVPDLPNGYLGAQPKFKEYGLSVMSHSDPVIRLQGNEVEVKIGYSDAVKTTASLIKASTEEESKDYVFTQSKGSVLTYMATLPSEGWWKLQIYALPAKDPGNQLIGVYNYIIDCPRIIKKAYPFPKQYAQWKDGCYIFEPMVLHKDVKGPSVRFRLSIPHAKAVAVVADQEWTHLKESGQKGLWEATVDLAKYYGKNTRVTVNANFGEDKTSYSTLLEYRV
ncbi:uncharacterized protein LOC135468479 [Liolophura sinensis]|uniref:uncharacterized protein LOC135468479 n=1 Tax=Liolophura sinensis TaxID=3198878 RepID=UPI003158619E